MPRSNIPEPIKVLSPELFDRVKERTEGTLLDLIKRNKDTRYVSESPVFGGFRSSLEHLRKDKGDEVRDDMLLESYRSAIPLTTYDSYEPFVKKFLERNCQEDDVRDMFSPGLPYFVAVSSSTTSTKPKYFAKYKHPPGSSYETVDRSANPVSDTGGKNCIVYSLNYRQLVSVLNGDGDAVKKLPVTLMSSGSIRMQNGIDVEKDTCALQYTAPRATSPIAVSFISKYRSFLLMHALFALADTKVETINTLFGTIFIDMIRYVEEEWDNLLRYIETGELPDWEGTDHVRQWLVPKFHASPERAAELRAIGRTAQEPGWLVRVWPMLKVVIGIASGVYAAVIPKMRHYVGPDVQLRSLGFTASEAYVGTVYDPENLNLYKVASDDIVEYLDVSKEEVAANLVAPWQVQPGHKYEVVLTNRDGMWRYRLGDVIEIEGFDPDDGAPVVRYVERRNVALRLGGAMLSEEHLAKAILAVQDKLGSLIEFTVVIDDRNITRRVGYLVEIQELGAFSFARAILIIAKLSKGTEADEAPDKLLHELCRLNPQFKFGLDTEEMRPPTIRILKPGTFADYRRWRIEVTNSGSGQMKVPVVMWDHGTREWIFKRIDREVGRPVLVESENRGQFTYSK
ncbi:GH3 auxin-responsive promoter [Pisolithus sp. B1]|nr:GH3 auxin-responsive promoter [Pisolithus sp. B1]